MTTLKTVATQALLLPWWRGDVRALPALLFLAGTGFIVYVMFGYPLILRFWANFRSRPVQKQYQPKTVSVILAVRDGEFWIRAKLQSILALHYPRPLMQILVVSDGSRDRTEEIAREFQNEGVELVCSPGRGKAAALNAGMERATGEILFFTDVRQPLDPESLGRLVAGFADPEVGVVGGHLVIRDEAQQDQTRPKAEASLYWRYEKAIRRRLSQIDSVLGSSGCIYAMRRSLALPLPPHILLDDMYLPLAAFFRGYRVTWEDDAKAFDLPTSLQNEFRRKIRTQAGVYQILGAYPQLLGLQNRMWFHFVSHKLARLLLPFAFLLLAITSFWLPGEWARSALAAQAFFYSLALADLFIPETFPLKRFSSAARTFVVLMAAALCAGSSLFLPHNRFWKNPT